MCTALAMLKEGCHDEVHNQCIDGVIRLAQAREAFR